MNKQYFINGYIRMSKNFMTPNVLKYEVTNDYRIIELATGTGFDQKIIYGVSELDSTLNTTGRGDMFYTLGEARKYYDYLINNK